MKDKIKTIFVCNACGETSARWVGRCASCNEWNTMVEDVVKESKKSSKASFSANPVTASPLSNIDCNEKKSRLHTGLSELDRVLGGGIVIGSLILLAGEPGAGKSTLLLQICKELEKKCTVLYVSGEESIRQIKLRANRLSVNSDKISLAAENNIDDICALIEQSRPGVVIIDSIQTMQSGSISSSAGSVSQVKECTQRLLACAKSLEIPTFIVGHVNKDGAIAGPKVMEHIVDTVLHFEGDKTLPYRILRAAKNRYGSTNEIGMFDMTASGLCEIKNPSSVFLEGRPIGISGSCVASTIEGTRPILSEVQALVTKTGFGTPRRATSGFDYNRANLLLAILEKRAGFFMGNLDVYINVVGGLYISDTACDLSVAMAIISSLTDKAIAHDTIFMGELGLGGEIRAVINPENRIREAARMGFKKAVVPKTNLKQLSAIKDIEIVGISYLKQAF